MRDRGDLPKYKDVDRSDEEGDIYEAAGWSLNVLKDKYGKYNCLLLLLIKIQSKLFFFFF